jgi:hypothetical protein
MLSGAHRLRGEGGQVGDVRVPVVVVVGIAIVVVTVLAVRLAYGAATSHDKPRVLVLGDSITDRSQAALKDELGAGFDLSIDGKTSFRVGQQLQSAERWSSRDFDQIVINLGTNDAIQGAAVEQSAADLAAMVALFPEARCIHLVTVNEDIPAEADPEAARRAAQLNHHLWTLAAADPRLHVVDWAALVRAELERGAEPTLDGVHPTDDAYELLAVAYAASIRPCAL